MCVAPRNLAALVFGAASFLPLACKDSTSPKTGSIRVTVTTQGQGGNLDRDGYMLKIDGGSATAVGVNAVVSITDVPTGSHLVLLEGVEVNCTVSGTNPRPVDVTGSEIPVAFFVSCGARTGTINVAVTTSGSEPDGDGYTVIVGGTPRGSIGPNGSLSIAGVTEGPWGVSLTGVALNCTVDLPVIKTVNVELAKSVQASFTVRCVPTVTLRVTARTTGVDLDSDGYSVLVQSEAGSTGKAVGINGTVDIPGLAPGNYNVSVQSIAANCNPVTPSRQIVAVSANPTHVAFDIDCEKPLQLAFVTTITASNTDIHVINSNSTGDQAIVSDNAADIDPAWSPDGTRIAFASRRSGNLDIYSADANGANPVRLTASTADDFGPTWSPDGARIAFVSQRDGNLEIYVMSADGSNQVRLTNRVVNDVDPSWSPNGAKISFVSNNGIAVMNTDGSGFTQLTTNVRGDRHPVWSPDGTKIAFSRGVSANTRDIFTMNADGTGGTPLTQGLQAQNPAWSPDGRKIAFDGISCDAYYYYYYGCESEIMVVGLDGTLYTSLATAGNSTSPTWRP